MDTAININDQRTADAFWTLLKPLKREVRQWLAMRLDESLKEQNNPIHIIQFIRIAYQMLKNL